MPDEKHVYDFREEAPIPSYEEATSSSHVPARRGPQEVSNDAERQTLLGHDLPSNASASASSSRRRNGYYHPPSVQSVRSSEDSQSSGLGSLVDDHADADMRQTIEEMDILDPEAAEDGRRRRNRGQGRFSKRFYSITNSLSGFHLPRIAWPSSFFSSIYARLPSIPEEYRPGWAVVARLCGLILIITLVYFLVVSEVMPMGNGAFGAPFNPEWVRQTAMQNVEHWRIQESLKYITSYDHLAGTQGSYVLGQWIEGKFKEAHMDTYTHDEYFAFMNYPQENGRRLAIVEPKEKAWEAELEERSVYDPAKSQTKSFHALSASGNVTGPLIYVNYGHKKDFKALWDSQIDVQGAIVLMRYHGTQPDMAMKLRAAQESGAAGVLMYSDPADDGYQKGDAWPNGRWRPEDSVQRGSVALSNMVIGDVLTPGRPSTKDQERMPRGWNPALVKIPSLPISWKTAQKLLQSLEGSGTEVPAEWVGGVPDVNRWWSGHPDKSPKVYLQNNQDEVEKQRITNVFGSFIGTEERAKKIIVGNHRDSWCFGAADPGSGTAVMLEVARVLGELRADGWRPLRTIEFASWDAGEYNRIGSTEHVEANLEELRTNAIAYINLDVGVTGDKLWANGSPIFQHAFTRVLGRLTDPVQNETVLKMWQNDNRQLGSLGASSDYVAFQHLAGTSSIDIGFSGPEHGDLKGSCYETFEWMQSFVDPGFLYHDQLTQVLVLLILELAQEPIMPLKLEDYAAALQQEGKKLLDWAEKKGDDYDIGIFQPLFDALAELSQQAQSFADWETLWYSQITNTGGFETQALTFQRMEHNDRVARFESDLLDLPRGEDDKGPHGLPDRDQFKHVVYAPNAYGSSSDAAVFPFVRDAIEKGDWKLAAQQINKTADIISFAGARLLN